MSQSASLLSAQIKLASAPQRWLFFAVFTISGFSGLIYESIWSHYLKLFLGHAAYAQSLVLMIFMGGLALGSWLAARFSERLRAPILAYAITEGIIGVIALVFHDTFVALSGTFYFSILPSIGSPAVGGLLKWTAAASLIIPQSILLGMTFPLMTAGVIRRYPDRPGGSLAMLYFTNSIGAAAGVLVSGFWLISVVGLPGTIMTAGLLNIALALVVWVLVELDSHPVVPAEPAHRVSSASAEPIAVLFLLAAALTGAASFIYEIGWIRMLSLVLGSTTHSFELMLSAFITGLALGGLWIKRRIDGIPDAVRFAGWVQVLMGVLAISTVPVYVETFDWMAGLLSALQRTEAGYGLYTAFSHLIALLVMVPTTFLAGMTLPLFTHVLMRRESGEGAIGRVYAANTLGSIAGVLFAVHVGMPFLGLQSLIAVGAALDILLGLALLYRSGARHSLGTVARAAVVGGAALVIVASLVDLEPKRLASGVYRYSRPELEQNAEVRFYRDGKTASISLVSLGSQLAVLTNGKPDAAIEMNPDRPPTADEITMVMAAALPLAYNPQAEYVANIGLGSGLTTHTLLGSETVRQVDTVEIEAAMVQAARGFGSRVHRAFDDPRSRIHIEDAKTFFSLHNRQYDVIVAEPSNPWVSGVASLFSEEFYRTVPGYLTETGVFVQWLQLYEFNDELVLSVLKALSKNFSDFAIYNTDDTNILIVAKATGRLPKPLFEPLVRGTLGPELSLVGLRSAADFLVRQTGSKQMLEALAAGSLVPANSDYFPYLDLNAGKARFKGERAMMFFDWSAASLPVLEMIGMEPFDYSAVTANETFQRAMLIERARNIYASMVLDDASSRPWLGPSLTALRLLGRSCAGQPAEDQLLLGLHALGELALPFLPAAEAAALVAVAVPPECLDRASPELRAWVDLYSAVAERDGRRMVTAGEAAMRLETSDPNMERYALEAAMLGAIASASPERALEVWNNRPASMRDMEPSPTIRLVSWLARSKDTGNSASPGH